MFCIARYKGRSGWEDGDVMFYGPFSRLTEAREWLTRLEPHIQELDDDLWGGETEWFYSIYPLWSKVGQTELERDLARGYTQEGDA